jgi:DNA repair photolyase
MALKKPTGDMYPFVDWIWNPVSGRCSHNCSYCYVKRIAKRFHHEQAEPHIVKAELHTNLGRGNKIFVCSGCDLFARDVPDEYIIGVINHAHLFSYNTYLFQTKNPERFASPLIGLSAEQDILCTTIETDQYLPEIMRNAPEPSVRAEYLSAMRENGFRTMVTIEPIMEFCLESMLSLIRKIWPKQVNIGADTGNNHLPEPSPEKIAALVGALRSFTRVHLKNNLKRLYREA